MKHLPMIARLLLGLIFVVFGVIGLFGIGPEPEMGEEASALMAGMMGTGYMWPLIKCTEIVCGLLLLTGLFVPLALVVLAPVVLNILLFHIFVAPEGTVIGIVLTALLLYVAHHYRESFSGMLQRKA